MKIELEKVGSERRTILERLLQSMLYEGGMEPGANGFIDWGESLDSYFVGSMHIPLFFTTEDKLVGFALKC